MSLPLLFPLAKCAVCVANEHDYGWWVLSGTALFGGIALALLFAWKDGRREPLPMTPDEP